MVCSSRSTTSIRVEDLLQPLKSAFLIRCADWLLAASQVLAVRFTDLRYFFPQLCDALFDGPRHDNKASYAGDLLHTMAISGRSRVRTELFELTVVPALAPHLVQANRQLSVSFISCASSASITWEPTASRRRPAFSSHLLTTVIIMSGPYGGDLPTQFAKRPRSEFASSVIADRFRANFSYKTIEYGTSFKRSTNRSWCAGFDWFCFRKHWGPRSESPACVTVYRAIFGHSELEA